MSGTETSAPLPGQIQVVTANGEETVSGFSSVENARAFISQEYAKPHPDPATPEGVRFKARARLAFQMTNPEPGEIAETAPAVEPMTPTEVMQMGFDRRPPAPAAWADDTPFTGEDARALDDNFGRIPAALADAGSLNVSTLIFHATEAMHGRGNHRVSEAEGMAELRRMYGGDAPADEAVTLAKVTISHLEAQGFHAGEFLNRIGAGNSPLVIKALADVGRALKGRA